MAGEGRGFCQGLCKWGEREKARKNTGEQTSFPPTYLCAGEAGEQCCSKWHCFSVFFLRKHNEFGNNPKGGYDNCPLFTMLTKQRLCVVRVVKINKTKLLKMIFSKLG